MDNKKRKSVKELRDALTEDSPSMSLIGTLFDEGTFSQLGAYVRRVTTPEKRQATLKVSSQATAR